MIRAPPYLLHSGNMLTHEPSIPHSNLPQERLPPQNDLSTGGFFISHPIAFLEALFQLCRSDRFDRECGTSLAITWGARATIQIELSLGDAPIIILQTRPYAPGRLHVLKVRMDFEDGF